MYVNVNTVIQITLVPGTNLLEMCNFCKLWSTNNELMILKMSFSQRKALPFESSTWKKLYILHAGLWMLGC